MFLSVRPRHFSFGRVTQNWQQKGQIIIYVGFYSRFIIDTRDCCSTNPEPQGQDAGESQAHRRVCEGWSQCSLRGVGKKAFALTSSVLITQLQQFPEGMCALNVAFVPAGREQADDWWVSLCLSLSLSLSPSSSTRTNIWMCAPTLTITNILQSLL